MQTKALEKRKCSFWFCQEDHYSHGYCVRHARQWERKADPLSGTDARYLYDHADQLIACLQAMCNQSIRLLEGSAGGYRMCMMCGAISDTQVDASKPLAHYDGCVLEQAQVLINMH